jgi:hypothetical protein
LGQNNVFDGRGGVHSLDSVREFAAAIRANLGVVVAPARLARLERVAGSR